jgi:hypothetical protein
MPFRSRLVFMSRPCACCCSPSVAQIAAAVLNGATDIAIAAQFGLDRQAVRRHRIQHIMAPAAAAAALAGKGRTAVQARAALAAASAEDPRVWIALDSVVRDLRRVRDRLDGAADDAAVARQYAPLAALSGQLLRADGLRAQLGGIGAQERGQPASGFKLTINVGTAAPLTIEGDAASIPDGYQIERE